MLEHKPLGYGAEGVAVDEGETIARELKHHIESVELEIHRRVELCGHSRIGRDDAVDIIEQRENAVDFRQHVEELVEMEVAHDDTGRKAETVSGRSRIERGEVH